LSAVGTSRDLSHVAVPPRVLVGEDAEADWVGQPEEVDPPGLVGRLVLGRVLGHWLPPSPGLLVALAGAGVAAGQLLRQVCVGHRGRRSPRNQDRGRPAVVRAALRSRTPNKPGPLPVEPPSGPYPVEAQLQEVAREVDQACLRALSNAELCLAWRRSYCSLVGTTSLRLRAVVVTSRQEYLDEMERRDARALTAWLAAGARAASGPERYLDESVEDP
jgi:hypothetical protein